MNKIISAIVIAFIVGTANAMPTDSIFLKMPDKLIPTLARKQRYELAEYFKAGKADSVQNLFGRNTILQKYDTANCHIVLMTSATGTTEIKKFTFSNNEKIIGIIQTVNQPVKFSSIQFFTEEWQSYTLLIEIPDYRNWINEKKLNDADLQIAWLENLLQKKYFSMHFTTSDELEIENNVLNTLSLEDRKIVEPFFINKTMLIKFVK